MRKPEERLQEKLEQLETGVPLEVCLANLPEEEAALLSLAAGLRQVGYAERDSQIVAAQRAHLLKIAAKENTMNQQSSPQSDENPFTRFLPAWLLQPRSLSGARAVIGIIFIFVLGTAVFWWSSRDTAMVESPNFDAGSEVSGSEVSMIPGTGTDSVAANTADRTTGVYFPSESTLNQEAAGELAPSFSVFVPAINSPEFKNPQTGILRNPQGLVEVQQDDGTWATAGKGYSFVAGQHIRTGALSSVRLGFYDGSEAYLGSNTEVAVNELDAGLADGPRTIVLTQVAGETEHDVAKVDTADSRYEVRTPTGSGVARGTTFAVFVTPNHVTRFDVDEGAVAVTNINVTVVVIAGQSTTINDGEAPSEPDFRITGQGEVTAIGDTWTIAGQEFETHDDTVIVGDPRVGDLVFVEGRLLADGTRVADRITLLRHSPANHFTINGVVETMEETTWTVSGQAMAVDEDTDVEEGVTNGNLVQVKGVILEDGTLLAQSIRLIEEEPGHPFEFTGVVQGIADDVWTISGVEITADTETEIDEDVAIGDVVAVEGWIIEDDTWLAGEIKAVEEDQPGFEFTGAVESMDPWIVAGIAFETRDWTEIEAGIVVGDLVKVEGNILEDGTWVANEIKLLDEDDLMTIIFVGTVDSMDPWVVSGLPLTVTEETLIDEEIAVGDLVKVEVQIQPDGTWLATRIELLEEELEPGCLSITAVVVNAGDGQIILDNWPTIELDESIEIEGEITDGSVIVINVCVADDGTITIISIIVIYQPVVTPEPPPPPPVEEGGGKVTVCHHPPGNPNARHTITIGRSALQSHLGHGDTMGPCS